MFSFQHKLIQEYLAAVYIAEKAKNDTTSSFLTELFPNWETVENHSNVVQFVCGILAETDASPVANHVAKVISNHICIQLDTGKSLKFLPLSFLELCQREGHVSNAINPYLCRYPSCGHPLNEVLANTELVYITDTNKNDTLQLIPSPAKIILELNGYRGNFDHDSFRRLWQALYSIQANVIAVFLRCAHANLTNMNHFSQLQYLHFDNEYSNTAATIEGLAESLNSWDSEPLLTYIALKKVEISRSIMAALCKCVHLKTLDLSWCDLREKLSILMASPPPSLESLQLFQCSLLGADVDQITQAIRNGRLVDLQDLDISYSSVLEPGCEGVLGRLMEALISTRPHKSLSVNLACSLIRNYTHPKQFSDEWKARLYDTNIKVKWGKKS